MHGVAQRETAVLRVGGLSYASEKAVVERRLGAQRGVLAVDANPVAQTATVEYDPEQTDVAALKRWVEECGYHCAGRSTPGHICDPLGAEPLAPAHDHAAVVRADEADGLRHFSGRLARSLVGSWLPRRARPSRACT